MTLSTKLRKATKPLLWTSSTKKWMSSPKKLAGISVRHFSKSKKPYGRRHNLILKKSLKGLEPTKKLRKMPVLLLHPRNSQNSSCFRWLQSVCKTRQFNWLISKRETSKTKNSSLMWVSGVSPITSSSRLQSRIISNSKISSRSSCNKLFMTLRQIWRRKRNWKALPQRLWSINSRLLKRQQKCIWKKLVRDLWQRQEFASSRPCFSDAGSFVIAFWKSESKSRSTMQATPSLRNCLMSIKLRFLKSLTMKSLDKIRMPSWKYTQETWNRCTAVSHTSSSISSTHLTKFFSICCWSKVSEMIN